MIADVPRCEISLLNTIWLLYMYPVMSSGRLFSSIMMSFVK